GRRRGGRAMTRTRLTWGLAAVAVVLPLGFAVGLGRIEPHGPPPALHASPVSHFPPAGLTFDRRTLGPEPGYRPQITNVRIVDLDRDGRPDVLVCDGQRNRVIWYRQQADGSFEEIPIGGELNCPCGTAVVDLDGDGDLDVVVA